MHISRFYTKQGQNPLSDVTWVRRSSEIINPDGKYVFKMSGVEVPETWSQVATDILAQKYLRKTEVPQEDGSLGGETSARQVFSRLVKCWRHWGEVGGYFDGEESGKAFEEEALYMLANQIAAPNSPQWFNTGLFNSYGIKGPTKGHWYCDEKSLALKEVEDAYERMQTSACIIQSVNDSLVGEGGIMDTWAKEARIFKHGSGVGTNFSTLRGKGERLSGGGKSSGLMSFLKIGDRAAGAIKSGGTTRRAAKMVCLDIDHPDVEDFISWKVSEEYKVATMVAGSRAIRRATKDIQKVIRDKGGDSDPKSNEALRKTLSRIQREGVPLQWMKRVLDLAKQGVFEGPPPEFTEDWESPGYETVSGQNSNNSIRVPNSFLDALERGESWNLVGRVDKELLKTLPAEDLWHKIVYSSWSCADPGIQFDSTINEWHTYPEEGRINSSNPCSEFLAIDNSSCNLASLNLVKFFSGDGVFKVDAFKHAVSLWTLILEITIYMSSFPSREVAENTCKYRTLGLGYANLGALLMRMGLSYDSNEGRAVAASITSLMTSTAYLASSKIAKEKGAFYGWEVNKAHMLRILGYHAKASGVGGLYYDGLTVRPMEIRDRDLPEGMREVLEDAQRTWREVLDAGERYGFRNAQTTLLAPTGTIGLLMDCDTTGVEPDYALVKYKKLAGGGYFKIINWSVPMSLRSLGYKEREIEEIQNYAVGNNFKGCLRNQHAPINSHSLNSGRGFKEDQIQAIEEALPFSFDIHSAFSPHILGEMFCKEVLGVSEAQLSDPAFKVLEFMGFSKGDIEASNLYYCGASTVEGAPHLLSEHYPVFACASKCGKTGKQYIPYLAHVEMLAAVQPFLSGAISKTVNMPEDSTISDVSNVYLTAWKKGVKCITVYREGSKLSQPLTAIWSDWVWEDLGEDATNEERVKRFAEKVTEMWVARRKTLPQKRRGYTQKASVGGHKVYLRTGEYPDGRLGEIFLDMHKEGAVLRSWMNNFAISVSLGLQYGVPLDEYVDAFTFSKFEPNGPVHGHDRIKMATSVIDYVFRDLAVNYLDRADLAHVKIAEKSSEVGKEVVKEVEKTEYKSERVERQLQGYTGDICPECGSTMMTRIGTCMKCHVCGGTTGCG